MNLPPPPVAYGPDCIKYCAFGDNNNNDVRSRTLQRRNASFAKFAGSI